MPIDAVRLRKLLKQSDFEAIFIEELGWDRHRSRLNVEADGNDYTLQVIAEKRSMAAFVLSINGNLPDYATRRKIERKVSRSVHEHLIIYHNVNQGIQVWQWVKREIGKPAACREHTYHVSQSGDALIQKLQSIAFSLDEEEGLTIIDVTSRVRAGFDVERVTKLFYDLFKKEHADFLKLLKGIPDEDLQRWYVSVMLNRLMFIYFIQKKGFLDNDQDYLRNKLAASKAGGKDRFYLHVLCPLFFEGFAKKPESRAAAMNKLLGKVPYLNGGLFLKHQIEKAHGKDIKIPDKAFEKIFDFFNQYNWHLDERPLRNDDEINPDVLGYIFEKYINQKQMGAYYTKEDITGYITRNTVIPFLLDSARKKCKIAFEGERSIWRLLKEDPDRYIYPAMRHGMSLDIHSGEVLGKPHELPANIAAGLNDVSKRTDWNAPAPAEFALPTEIWREVVARRQRYQEVQDKLAAGDVRDINDLITLNLDIEQFAQDVIETCEGPELLRAIWVTIAGKVPEKSNEKHQQGITVLDPACGSGAFLFAALNLLEVLYEACLDRMQAFLDDLDKAGDKSSKKYSDFCKVLEQVEKHPSRKYFVYKSIVISNLFGVDIMEEAVEICKLRLFLKLVAQIDHVEDIEPLPDIDFNIRAGNTLVGYAQREQVAKALTRGEDPLLAVAQKEEAIQRIEVKLREVDELFTLFRQQQTKLGGTVTAEDKQALQDKLDELDDELNKHLATEYGIDPANAKKYDKWLSSHQPFHWFVDFYGIMATGGFDVVIGNPPYVEYREVRSTYTVVGYKTESCGNLYAYFWERSLNVASAQGLTGLIVPVASVCTTGYQPLQKCLRDSGLVVTSNFNDRPSKLFDGLEHIRLSIILVHKGIRPRTYSTSYNKWQSVERQYLFHKLCFIETTEMNQAEAMAKIGCDAETDILSKIKLNNETIANHSTRNGFYHIYYTRKLSHFVQILDFVPEILDPEGNVRQPSELKDLPFVKECFRNEFLALLNSSLFYWWLTTFSDCRNLNKRDVTSVPLNVTKLKPTTAKALQECCVRLMDDIRRHSEVLTMTYQNIGQLRIQCTYPKKSKDIIDEIDAVLASHYGFTEHELDLIINFDIKYRMGIDGDDD